MYNQPIEGPRSPRSETTAPGVNDLPSKLPIGPVSLHPVTMNDAVEWALAALEVNRVQYTFTANVDHLVQLGSNPELEDAYARADLAVADGQALFWLGRLLGQKLPQKIAGVDLFHAICSQSSQQSIRLFMLGGRDSRSIDAGRTLTRMYPSLRIVGRYTGIVPVDASSGDITALIAASKANLIAVFLGCPAQELWISRNAASLPPGLYLGLGGTVDMLSGAVRRASRRLRVLGLEWLFRLAQEPGRLWRRYLVRDLKFLPLAMKLIWLRLRQAGEKNQLIRRFTRRS